MGDTWVFTNLFKELALPDVTWHDAPERSPVREMTFLQAFPAWQDYFGCRR